MCIFFWRKMNTFSCLIRLRPLLLWIYKNYIGNDVNSQMWSCTKLFQTVEPQQCQVKKCILCCLQKASRGPAQKERMNVKTLFHHWSYSKNSHSFQPWHQYPWLSECTLISCLDLVNQCTGTEKEVRKKKRKNSWTTNTYHILNMDGI